jgi:hypothetical protein
MVVLPLLDGEQESRNVPQVPVILVDNIRGRSTGHAMRAVTAVITFVTFVAAGLSAQGPPRPGPQIVWSPKSATPDAWTPPHRPHTKLADVLARHAGRADWVETIVDDDTLHADYISMAPGAKTPRRMNADTREWWVIQDGLVRFAIDGQEPFVGSL